MKYIVSLIVFSLILNLSINAQDRVFAYTYQTNVLNKGDFDLEFQNTLRTGKVGAFSPYVFGQHLDQRLELEFGLGSNVQTSFYLNSERFDYADTSSSSMNSDLKISFSNEWKWKLSDPVANGIGSTLYGEFEFGGNNIEFEGKLILDKRIVNEFFAFNIVGKYEIERDISRKDNITTATWIHNSPVEFNFGYMHFFSKDFSLGIEGKNNNDIIQGNGWMNSVWFAGPACHFTIGRCFVLLSALPQIINTHKTIYAPGSRDLNDFEAAEFRVLAGYDF